MAGIGDWQHLGVYYVAPKFYMFFKESIQSLIEPELKVKMILQVIDR